MKYLIQILLVVSAVTRTATAALPQEQVSVDAKWLLHIDISQFRSTKVGGYIFTEIVEKQLSKPVADLKRQLKIEIDPDKILQQVSSITVYGTAYNSPEENSVVLVRIDRELEKVIVGALAGLSLAGSNSPVAITQTQIGNVTLYALKENAFFAVQPGKPVVVLGKSRAITEKAAQVLAGKAANLTKSKSFSEFADVKKAFFFLGVAEGFSESADLPPQARLLQLADGGRLVLGENADLLFLNLALRAKTSEIVTQMQQIIEGLIALGSLGQPENKDVAQLMNSVKVTSAGNIVSLNVEYPVESAIRVLGENKDKIGVHAGSKSRTSEAGRN